MPQICAKIETKTWMKVNALCESGDFSVASYCAQSATFFPVKGANFIKLVDCNIYSSKHIDNSAC